MKLGPKAVLAICIVTAVVTWAAVRAPDPSPQPDRPVLTIVARIAKALLWAALLAEEPPQEQAYNQTIGPDGYPTISHERSL